MTFVIKVRGSPTPTIAAEYYCPAHGRFELDVERTAAGDAPDVMPCPFVIVEHTEPIARVDAPDVVERVRIRLRCGDPAIWCISAPLAKVRSVEAVKGRSQKPERSTWTDTRNIGEGQPLHEWREDRAAVWERKRQEDVVAFAREHNERVRFDS